MYQSDTVLLVYIVSRLGALQNQIILFINYICFTTADDFFLWFLLVLQCYSAFGYISANPIANFEGSEQQRRNSIELTKELRLCCSEPSPNNSKYNSEFAERLNWKWFWLNSTESQIICTWHYTLFIQLCTVTIFRASIFVWSMQSKTRPLGFKWNTSDIRDDLTAQSWVSIV